MDEFREVRRYFDYETERTVVEVSRHCAQADQHCKAPPSNEPSYTRGTCGFCGMPTCGACSLIVRGRGRLCHGCMESERVPNAALRIWYHIARGSGYSAEEARAIAASNTAGRGA